MTLSISYNLIINPFHLIKINYILKLGIIFSLIRVFRFRCRLLTGF